MLPSIIAGIREKKPAGGEAGAADVDDCLSFLIQETKV
jgi:hypothetical protein